MMKRIVAMAEEGISLLELLLDETLCEGEILAPLEIARLAGGLNNRLRAKRKYELLLRIAQKGTIGLEEVHRAEEEQEIKLLDDAPELIEQYGWQTDCYVIGKYRTILWESGYYDAAVEAVLNEAQKCGQYEEAVQYLMQMIGNTAEYYKIDDATKPILIYKGDPVCHNIPTVSAMKLGTALEKMGELVIYFDIVQEDIFQITRFANQRFKAVIGIHSSVFEMKTEDGTYFHEYIHGPKFNFLFDHPVWVKSYILHPIPDFHILIHDSTYVSFIKKYYKKDAILFPPAGMYLELKEKPERIYDVTFIGTYSDYRREVKWIYDQKNRTVRFFANRFLLIMRKNPNLTAETAFEETLNYYGMTMTEEEIAENMRILRRIIYCVSYYYREYIMRKILQAGIQVNVFGNGWEESPLRNYRNLICHPDVTLEESLVLFQKSKISLNILSWHKGGFTERMAGIMLAGAVLATDDSLYLHGRYDENDMIIFDLEHIEELPEKIKRMLSDEVLWEHVAKRGREKAEQEHTWDKRAEQLVELLRQLKHESHDAI